MSKSKILTILAPMDDVTDTVFRRIVADCAPYDLALTEFVNVDGLCSPGRPKLLHKLSTSQDSGRIVAQIWGKNPKNFQLIASEIASGELPGFCGVDLNFGCPEKSVVKNECCSALQQPELWGRAGAIIEATQAGLEGRLPLSIKTRLGFRDIDYGWHEFLLKYKPHMLTVHVRTTKQMSKVPAQWEAITPIVELRNALSPQTEIILNGDIENREQGESLAGRFGVDGIMIGRGVFKNPFCFAINSENIWGGMDKSARIALLKKHLRLHEETYGNNVRPFASLKKFAKIYVSDFPDASELRMRIMDTNSVSEAIEILDSV